MDENIIAIILVFRAFAIFDAQHRRIIVMMICGEQRAEVMLPAKHRQHNRYGEDELSIRVNHHDYYTIAVPGGSSRGVEFRPT